MKDTSYIPWGVICIDISRGRRHRPHEISIGKPAWERYNLYLSQVWFLTFKPQILFCPTPCVWNIVFLRWYAQRLFILDLWQTGHCASNRMSFPKEFHWTAFWEMSWTRGCTTNTMCAYHCENTVHTVYIRHPYILWKCSICGIMWCVWP